MTNRQQRLDLLAPVLIAALVMTMAGGCVPVDAAGLETFAVDLLRNIAAVLLL